MGAHPDDAPLVKEKLACLRGFECLAAVLVNDGDDGVTDTLSTAGGTVGAVPN